MVVKWPAAKSLARSDVGNGRSATSINALPQTLKLSPQTPAIAAAAANSLPTKTPQTLSPPLPEKETRAQIPSRKEEQEERHKPSSWVLGFRGSRWLSCNRAGVVEDSKNG